MQAEYTHWTIQYKISIYLFKIYTSISPTAVYRKKFIPAGYLGHDASPVVLAIMSSARKVHQNLTSSTFSASSVLLSEASLPKPPFKLGRWSLDSWPPMDKCCTNAQARHPALSSQLWILKPLPLINSFHLLLHWDSQLNRGHCFSWNGLHHYVNPGVMLT